MDFSIVSFALLGLSIVLAFVSSTWPVPLAAFAFSCVLALVAGVLNWPGILSVLILGVLCFLAFKKSRSKYWHLASAALLLVAGHLVMKHLLPGFNNPKVLSGVQLSETAIPYSMYLNFDKAALGFFLVLFAVKADLARSAWSGFLRSAVLFFLPTAFLLILLAYAAGMVVPDFKVPAFILPWIFSNLLITCVAEEAFFRRFALSEIQELLGASWIAAAAALILSSVFFAYYHLNGGPLYAGFSLVAGLCYGTAYMRSGRVEVAILVHFLVNLTHILFFTYPFLASSVGLG